MTHRCPNNFWNITKNPVHDKCFPLSPTSLPFQDPEVSINNWRPLPYSKKERLQHCTVHWLRRNTSFQSFQPVCEAVNSTRLPNKDSFRGHILCKQKPNPMTIWTNMKNMKNVVPTGKQSRHPKGILRRMWSLQSDSYILQGCHVHITQPLGKLSNCFFKSSQLDKGNRNIYPVGLFSNLKKFYVKNLTAQNLYSNPDNCTIQKLWVTVHEVSWFSEL